MKTLPSAKLTLRDRLSHLTFLEACKIIGPEGKQLIRDNANTWDIDPAEDVRFTGDLFSVKFPAGRVGEPIFVTITLMSEVRQRLNWNCTHCFTACPHIGATFSLILEEKSALGLAEPPPEPRAPVESLSEEELVQRALADRAERSKAEKMKVTPFDRERPWTDYIVTSRLSGKSYRVSLRGLRVGESYCSCPDFRTNTLGVCKHILKTIEKVKRRFSSQELARPYRRKKLGLHLRYGQDVTLRLLVPAQLDGEAGKIIEPLRDRPIEDLQDLMKRISRLQKLGREVMIYPDAEEFIQQRLLQDRLREQVETIRKDPAKHPLRKTLLKTELLPYQLDGIAFAAGAGRAILADDMGLGKTIQGVGAAEFLAREAEIQKVLVICPASLKSQWRMEIHRFCDRTVQMVGGSVAERGQAYANDRFFTICNYEQVLRDILDIEKISWDLIILDEGQRIKNWQAKTSNVIKSLRSRFALVLSGTPLENRLDDLYSVVQFVDDRRLGPGFRFFNRHRMVDEKGKVLGYKNLAELRKSLTPVLLRRTRQSVRLDLPQRTMEFVRIPATEEQLGLHTAHMRVVSSIVRKKFITEMDLLRLQQALLMCRMAADGTYLVTKEEPNYSTKLERIDDLLEQLFAEEGRKVIVFSEWTTMLNLIEPLLNKRRLKFVRLDGSIPQKKRAELVHTFQNDPKCRLFLTTNAGSTGLNLQAANTIINVDLPWNPAVLEQRIARAHRMGQKQPVQVFVLISEGTIEENLLQTIAAKKDLALAALDSESEVDEVKSGSGLDQLKSRLEVLLGAKAEAAVDQSKQRQEELSTQAIAAERRERVSAAGGELLGAAFKFLGELVASNAAPPPETVAKLRDGLAACVTEDQLGKSTLTVTLPDKGALDGLANALAKFLTLGTAAN